MYDPKDKKNKYETIYIPEKKKEELYVFLLKLAALCHVNFVKLECVDLIET